MDCQDGANDYESATSSICSATSVDGERWVRSAFPAIFLSTHGGGHAAAAVPFVASPLACCCCVVWLWQTIEEGVRLAPHPGADLRVVSPQVVPLDVDGSAYRM